MQTSIRPKAPAQPDQGSSSRLAINAPLYTQPGMAGHSAIHIPSSSLLTVTLNFICANTLGEKLAAVVEPGTVSG